MDLDEWRDLKGHLIPRIRNTPFDKLKHGFTVVTSVDVQGPLLNKRKVFGAPGSTSTLATLYTTFLYLYSQATPFLLL